MRRYVSDKGDRTEGVEIRALAPIDLREPGDLELGNRFGIVAVLLPVGVEHPLERLMMVRQRMLDLKTPMSRPSRSACSPRSAICRKSCRTSSSTSWSAARPR